ncbi:MAG: hypothetical protein NTY05_03595 [Rhodocyclales bacterium]|nr:hypothetical protein [Rhodocyclales bacterium]
MRIEKLKPDLTVHGPLFPEPELTVVTISMGATVTRVGKKVPRVNRLDSRVCALKCDDAQQHRVSGELISR